MSAATEAMSLLNVAEKVALHATHLITFVRFYACVSGGNQEAACPCMVPLIGSTPVHAGGCFWTEQAARVQCHL